MVTASFSEVRQNLTAIGDRVAREGIEVMVFKRSKPLFMIVPVTTMDVEFQSASGDVGASGGSGLSGKQGEPDENHLLARALRMREEMPPAPELASMSIEDMKRELASRV